MTPAAVLSVIVRANTAEANAALARTQGQLRSTGMAAAGTQAKMMSAARGASMIGAAVAAGSAAMAVQFDQSMTRVQTQAGASADEIRKLRPEVLALARDSQFGPDALANALFRVESHGYRGAKAMHVLDQSQKLAAVGGSDLEQTTFALSAALNSGIKGSKDMGKATGMLNAIVGEGSMRMDEMVGALSTGILPAAANFGITLHQVGAALDVMTRAGVPAQLAATRLRMTFSLLGAPSDKATGELQAIGLSSTDLAHAMRGPQGLIGAVQLLHDHLQRLSPTDQAQLISRAFGGGRSSTAIMTLVQNVGELGKVYDETGAKASQFNNDVATQAATPAARLHKAWSNIQVDLINLGATLVPVFVSIMNGVAGMVNVFDKLPAPVKEATVLLLLMAYPMAKIIVLGRAVAVALGLVEVASAATGASAAAATPMIMGVGKGMMGIAPAAAGAEEGSLGLAAALTGPVGLAVAAAVVVGGLAYLAVKLSDTKSAYEKGMDAAHGLNEALYAQSKAVDQVHSIGKKLGTVTQKIVNLEAQGKGGTQEWSKAIRKQADLWWQLSTAQTHQRQEAAKAADKNNDLRNAISDQRDEIKSLQSTYGTWNDQTSQVADEQQHLKDLQDQLVISIQNQSRAAKGMQLLPTDWAHTFGTFQRMFGKTMAQKFSLLPDPHMVTEIERMANTLQSVGKFGAAHKILISAETPEKKLQDLMKELRSITGGSYNLSMNTDDVVKAEKRMRALNVSKDVFPTLEKVARSSLQSVGGTALFEMGKINNAIRSGRDPTNQLVASYRNMISKIATAMAQGKMNVSSGQAEINRLLGAELKLLGVNTSIGSRAPAVQAHGHGQSGNVWHTVPGHGTGDQVNVSAKLEPGELFGVINRRAAEHVNAINKKWPRFGGSQQHMQKGGLANLHYSGLNPDAVVDDEGAAALNKSADAARRKLAQEKRKHAAAGGPGPASGPGGTTSYMGVTMAVWVAQALKYAAQHGSGNPQPTSGYRPGFDPHAPSGSEHALTRYPGGAVDFGGMDDPPAFPKKMAVVNATRRYVRPLLAPIGFHDDGHASGTGHQRGGVIGLQKGGVIGLGGFQKGGTGAAVHQIENKGMTLDSTAYGPPWGGIQGGGTTATGIDLHSSPHKYIVAVDPGHIPLHSKLAIWPNPFNYLGEFGAEDTGGAIQGNRIDFYDWRGRSHQLGWGRKTVKGLLGGLHGKAAQSVGASGGGAPAGPGAAKLTKPQQKKIARLGLPPKLQQAVDNLTSLTDYYGNLADRASQLGAAVPGDGKTLDEVDWLKAELVQLLKLRNALIAAHEQLVTNIAKLNAMLKKTKGKDARKAITKKIGDDQTKADDIMSSITDVQGPRGPMGVLSSLPSVGALGGTIFDVQMKINQAGGSAAATDASDSDAAKLALALQANKSLLIGAAQLPVLSEIPTMINQLAGTPFLGGFASGTAGARTSGVALVGEKGPELVPLKAGQPVYPTQQGMSDAELLSRIEVHVHGDVVPFDDRVEDVVEVKLRRDSSSSRRRHG